MTEQAAPEAAAPGAPPTGIHVESYRWPEVTAGTDLAALVAGTLELRDGDVVVLTSKVVSKSQGLVVRGDRGDLVASQSRRIVARRGPTVIAETAHGLVMAAAGIDSSNVPPGSVVSLPPDSDESAHGIRSRLRDVTGCNVAVLITDTAGRAWRNGQTDMAIGCAGMLAMVDLAGSLDTHANLLQVTAPAIADELAAAADLVKGKATGRPLAVIRGLAGWVLPVGDPGPGARSVVRRADDDLFGLGTRDAVRAAVLRDDPQALAHFPRRIPADTDPFESLVSEHPQVRLSRKVIPATAQGPSAQGPSAPDSSAPGPSGGWLVQVDVSTDASSDGWLAAGRLLEKVDALAAANRLGCVQQPTEDTDQAGWTMLARTLWFVA